MNFKTTMRRFVLKRHEDASGVSGTGLVVEGVQYSDGSVDFHWLSAMGTHTSASNIESVKHIHGHDGKTEVVWLDPDPFVEDKLIHSANRLTHVLRADVVDSFFTHVGYDAKKEKLIVFVSQKPKTKHVIPREFEGFRVLMRVEKSAAIK